MYNINVLGYELPELPYGLDALEPHISKELMTIHHGNHHKAYVDKLLGVLESDSEGKELMGSFGPVELLRVILMVPDSIRQKVINFCGGHVNHSFFWTIMTLPSESSSGFSEDLEVVKAIVSKWGSIDKFMEEFSGKANALFGSGWSWLVIDGLSKELSLVDSKDQDSPYSNNLTPLLCIDLWEHAYYIDYQYKRADYVKAFWNVVNWKQVNEYYINSLN